MRAVDTSVWIELFDKSPLSRKLRTELPARHEIIVPTIVQLELSKWLLREASDKMADRAITYTMKCFVVPLDTEIALRAAGLCRKHKLSTADAVIYGSAQAHNADLLTCDAHFKGLPGVVYFAKFS